MFNKRGENNLFKIQNKKGQVTIFIIIAILIIISASLIVILKPKLFQPTVPKDFQSVYNNFLSCLEEETLIGIDLLETQGGYIILPEKEEGSPNIPFSSHLDFLENPIPYWYYVSGSNIPKEQMPTKSKMESELNNFLKDRIEKCDFQPFYEQGFEISRGEPQLDIKINNEEVIVDVYMDLNIEKEEDITSIKSHKVSVQSNLGSLYTSAKLIYEKEKKEMFLEEYGIDVLRLYAPVDGIELTCAPKIWNSYEIFSSLQEAIEVNTFALSTKKPSTKSEKYFFVETSLPHDVRFITSKNWPMSFEVLPSEGSMLIAEPVRDKNGIGVIGFCFVPYHFVYNFNYPVLIQVSEGKEIFQFPFAVVIKNNNPRVSLNYTSSGNIQPHICPYKNVKTKLTIRDLDSNPVDAEIYYDCLGESCYIGKTNFGFLEEEFPQCINGFVNIKAEGFAEKKYQYSTNVEGNADIILNKLYNKNIDLNLDNNNYNGEALIYFNSDENSQIVYYPQQKEVNLSEGDYEISVYVYKNSSIKLGESTHRECIEVPSSGILGIFGATQEDCFDMNIPSQIVSSALTAGGKADIYFSENNLKNYDNIMITANDFGIPNSMEDLQNNYLLFDTSKLEVNLI